MRDVIGITIIVVMILLALPFLPEIRADKYLENGGETLKQLAMASFLPIVIALILIFS